MDKSFILKKLEEQLKLAPGSKVLVVGLGETGYSVASFLLQLDIQLAVVDSRVKPPYLETLSEKFPNIPVFTGGFDKSAFEVATHMMVSPGVDLKEMSVARALQQGVQMFSDIDVFSILNDKPVLAVTGSNGKSTVTTMLGHMATECGINVCIGGNLGLPVLDMLNDEVELYVIELSSFQLERTRFLTLIAATVLNVSSDHLDRYDSLETYAAVKQKIYADSDAGIINLDDDRVNAMSTDIQNTMTFSIESKADFYLNDLNKDVYLCFRGQDLLPVSDLPFKGKHNYANALAAIALAYAAKLDLDKVCSALKSYKNLEHRMQEVAEVNGSLWINDSKATNIGACVAALQAFKNKLILIAGGDAKGADMSALVPYLVKKVDCLILIGKDAEKIEQAVEGKVPCMHAVSIEAAVKIANQQLKHGENVILSPACASLDQFKNYQDRGNRFMTAVRQVVL